MLFLLVTRKLLKSSCFAKTISLYAVLCKGSASECAICGMMTKCADKVKIGTIGILRQGTCVHHNRSLNKRSGFLGKRTFFKGVFYQVIFGQTNGTQAAEQRHDNGLATIVKENSGGAK
jgi:hypothetical protein